MLKNDFILSIVCICGLALALLTYYFLYGSWFEASNGIAVVSGGIVAEETSARGYTEAELRLPGKSRNIIETVNSRKKVVLCFFSAHQDISAFMDGTPLFNFNAFEGASPYLFYAVNTSQYGKEIKVEFASMTKRYSRTLFPVYIGELGAFLNHQNIISAFKYIVSTLFFLCGLTVALYAVISLRKYTSITQFLLTSLLLILIGLLLTFDTTAITKLIPYRYLSRLLQFLLYLTPVPYFLSIALQAKNRMRFALYAVPCLLLLLAVTTVVLDFLEVVYVPDTSGVFAVFLIAGLIVAFSWAVTFSRVKVIHCFFLLLSISAVAFDMAAFIKLSPVEDFRGLKCVVLISAVFLFIETLEDIHIVITNNAALKEVESFAAGFITENYNRLNESIRNVEVLRHDVANHYQALLLLYKQKQHDKAIAYLQQLNSEIEAATPTAVQNILVESIVHSKLSSSKNVCVEQNISVPPTLPYSDNDICSLIVNILDNALEAAGKCANPFINLKIYTKNEMFFVKCRNSKSEDVMLANNVIQSSKQDKRFHGFGLKIIDTVVAKYDGTIFVDYDEETFSINISLPLVTQTKHNEPINNYC